MDDVRGYVLVEDHERLAAGTRFRGRYLIIDEIGASAFGTVYRAEDEATGYRVALRLLPHELASTFQTACAGERGRLVAEASTAHQGLARVFEFGCEDGRPFAVTELVEGRRLSALMAKRELVDARRALRLALAFGGAIETLHKTGLSHGALRARNVMVLAHDRVKVMDLELASLRGGPSSEEADVRAFALLLREMLGDATRGRGRALSPAVEAVVTRALDEAPAARPYMQDLLNLLWADVHRPVELMRRPIGVLACVVLAVSSGLFTPRPTASPRLEEATPAAPVVRSAAPVPSVTPVEASVAPAPAAFWVQVGAFENADAARRVAAGLRRRAYRVEESSATPVAAAGTLHRVRVGPFADTRAARAALPALRDLGYRPFIARERP